MAETPQQIVDRELREFKRYTGDGLPGEPVNAPLPVGDPQSGVHNPKKANLRNALKQPLEGWTEQADRAESEADRAANYVNDIVAEKEVPITATRNGMEALEFPAGMNALGTFGFSSLVDGIEGNDWGLRRIASDPGHDGAVQDADGDWWEDPFWTDIIVRIPTDFPDLQSAIDAYSRTRIRQGAKIVLLIESGHALTHGLKMVGGDYSQFVIQHEADGNDPGSVPVTLDPGFVGVDNYDADAISSSFRSNRNLIVGIDTRLPILECRIDMDSPRGSSRLGHGWYAQSSISHIKQNCGVINAGLCGFSAQNGFSYGLGSIWSGAGSEGIRIQQAGIAAFQSAVADDCHHDAVSAASNGSVFSSRGSNLTFILGSAQNSGQVALECHRAVLIAWEANVDGSLMAGVTLHDGLLMFRAGSARNCGDGFRVYSGGRLNAAGADFTGVTGYAVSLGDGANHVNLFSATMGGATFAEKVISDSPGGVLPNLPSRQGVVYSNTPGPLQMGTFSESGAENGKEIGAASVLSSSRNSTGGQSHVIFHNANGRVGDISTNGSATEFNTSSDEKLKDFIGEMDPERAIAIIKADPVREFTWKGDGTNAVGWGAQTSYSVSKDLATPGGWRDPVTDDDWIEGGVRWVDPITQSPWEEGESRTDEEGEVIEAQRVEAVYVPWGVDQGKRTPYLWAAVTHLLNKVDELEAKLARGKDD